MGTRNLTVIKLDDDIKVAQYGQWDGYPSGQGVTVLNTMKDITETSEKLEKFKNNVRSVKNIDEKKLDQKWREAGSGGEDLVSMEVANKFKELYPELSRDTCAEIIQIIRDNENVEVHNQMDFATDTLFCEWAYLIDLDEGKIEVHTGGLKYKDNLKDETLVKTYDINDLPNENDFINELEELAY